MDLKNPDRERPEQFCEEIEPWANLAAAIIKLACEDYKWFSWQGRVGLEKFFRSSYFRNISNIDPDWLIKNLREMYPIKTGIIKGGE